MAIMSDRLVVRLHPDLKELIAKEADSLSVFGGMGELAVRILAEHYGRPDLATIPRKPMGRPRKKQKQFTR